jgi:uncharacterized protein YgiM (DUF1202 family)
MLPAAPPPAQPLTITSPAAAAASQPALTVAQPFVGSITTDKVYVRSGPGTAYYELGQLARGDLVYVVGASKGWYQILPPNGTYCLVAKELVDLDPSGASCTVKADYVNIRAGTAIYKNRDIAVLAVVRKGTKLRVLNATGEKYVEVAPPEHVSVYISPQFVHQTTAEYKVPSLKLPAGITGPAQTVSAPTSPPTAADNGAPTIDIPPEPAGHAPDEALANNHEPTPPTPAPGEAPAATRPSAAQQVPIPVPAVTYSQTATQKFNDLNTRYQEELRKPLPERNIDALLTEYKDLLKAENLAPSVKMGTESRIDALEKIAAVQRMAKEAATSDQNLAQQREALQQQYSTAEKLINEYQRSSPFVAEGTLQSSTIVKGKYALVNPATGRVVAYVDPNAEVDISTLLGKYVGLRGTTSKPDNSDITVIHVANATLLPAPAASK